MDTLCLLVHHMADDGINDERGSIRSTDEHQSAPRPDVERGLHGQNSTTYLTCTLFRYCCETSVLTVPERCRDTDESFNIHEDLG